MECGGFKLFDYGENGNLALYNQKEAYDIPIQNIKDVPIGLFVGLQDDLATPEGGRWAQ